jgi:hypothetical protein
MTCGFPANAPVGSAATNGLESATAVDEDRPRLDRPQVMLAEQGSYLRPRGSPGCTARFFQTHHRTRRPGTCAGFCAFMSGPRGAVQEESPEKQHGDKRTHSRIGVVSLAGPCDTGRAPAKDAVPDDGSRRAPKTQAATGTTRHPSTGTVNRALTPQNIRRTRRNK